MAEEVLEQDKLIQLEEQSHPVNLVNKDKGLTSRAEASNIYLEGRHAQCEIIKVKDKEAHI
ncbi:MAG: hypothetical protein ACMG6E_07375 [Candidatus Roizmanbacteria bacterium]